MKRVTGNQVVENEMSTNLGPQKVAHGNPGTRLTGTGRRHSKQAEIRSVASCLFPRNLKPKPGDVRIQLQSQ